MKRWPLLIAVYAFSAYAFCFAKGSEPPARGRQGAPTAFSALAVAQQYAPEGSQAKMLAIVGPRSKTSLTPTSWQFVYWNQGGWKNLKRITVTGGFSPEEWSVLLAAWGSLSLLSLRSRPVLFLSIPWSVMLGLAPFAAKLPSSLPIGREPLLMLEEGNIGDSSIAARDLGLEFLPFRDGLASLFPDGQVSLPLPESRAGPEDREQLL